MNSGQNPITWLLEKKASARSTPTVAGCLFGLAYGMVWVVVLPFLWEVVDSFWGGCRDVREFLLVLGLLIFGIWSAVAGDRAFTKLFRGRIFEEVMSTELTVEELFLGVMLFVGKRQLPMAVLYLCGLGLVTGDEGFRLSELSNVLIWFVRLIWVVYLGICWGVIHAIIVRSRDSGSVMDGVNRLFNMVLLYIIPFFLVPSMLVVWSLEGDMIINLVGGLISGWLAWFLLGLNLNQLGRNMGGKTLRSDLWSKVNIEKGKDKINPSGLARRARVRGWWLKLSNPILVRELQRFYNRPWVVRNSLLVSFGVVLVFSGLYPLNISFRFIGLCLLLVLPLKAALTAVDVIAGEREKKTWEMVTVSRLSPSEIIDGAAGFGWLTVARDLVGEGVAALFMGGLFIALGGGIALNSVGSFMLGLGLVCLELIWISLWSAYSGVWAGINFIRSASARWFVLILLAPYIFLEGELMFPYLDGGLMDLNFWAVNILLLSLAVIFVALIRSSLIRHLAHET